MVNIRGDKRNDRGAFGIDHLLQLLAHLAPAAGFEQRGRRAGAVAHVGNGNLDGILVHRYLVTQNLGADNGVLGKVLGRAATDHKETRLGAGHLDLSQLYKVAHRVDAKIRLAFLGALPLMLADAETCRAVTECGHKDRHTALVAGLNQAVLLHGTAVVQPLAKLIDELARAVGTGLEHIGQLERGVVTSLQLFLVDKSIVDAVDVEFTQLCVGNDVLLRAYVVLETQGLEKVHINNRRTGRDNHVNHLVAHHIYINLHTAGSRCRACNRQDVSAFLFGTHLHQYVGSTCSVTAGERHTAHSVDDFGRVILLDVNVLYGFFQKVFFFHFSMLNLYLLLNFKYIRHCLGIQSKCKVTLIY